MTILRESDELTLNDLPPDFFEAVAPSSRQADITEDDGHVTFYEAEKRLIIEALNKFGWNRSKAAAYLNIPRHILIYRMKKFEIHPVNSV
jgi:two-component system NtrC family response regulator